MSSVLDLHFRQQVEELFDTYAPNFEEELAALGYDVPTKDIDALYDSINTDGNNFIEFSELKLAQEKALAASTGKVSDGRKVR